MTRPVFAVENSDNSKIGLCSATYVTQASCPASCPLLNAGCYAEFGYTGAITRALANAASKGPAALARLEARAIDRLSGDRPLRLHVVGDCRTPKAARIVAQAAERYRRRGGRPVWTYTHAWRTVPRAAWLNVSVLASCETPTDLAPARALGYAGALIVRRFASFRAHDVQGERIIPCPQQTGNTNCRRCGLCFDDRRLLRAGLSIAFEAHGSGARRLPLPTVEG